MHIWSLKRLKADLLGPGLSDRQSLPYLVIVLTCVSAAFVAVPRHNFWSVVYGATIVGSIIVAALLAYFCNGGAGGRDFLSRFFSIVVVCGARWLLMFVLPLTLLAVVIPGTPWALSFPGEPGRPPMGRYDVIMVMLMVPPLLWRIATQMRDLNRRSSGAMALEAADNDDGWEPLED
ncbi:MAG: hypothetical protein VX951_04340 [Planctomycetota bacterium]|nr:hypothetical protein [Planctomycetota bacterium]